MTALKLRDLLAKAEPRLVCRHDYQKTGLTASAVVDHSSVSVAARALYEAGYFLEDISGMQVKEGLLVTYHYDSVSSPGRVAVRALADADGSVHSICSVFQGAEWHERESSDFLGLKFIGNTNPVPLLLPDDFPDAPPLLKEAKALAAMADLKLFGDEQEILDPAWQNIVSPPAADTEGGAA
ncbi:NADH-quinone oxidoreductase subunit C [Deltaproteobacteria bacterium OttesenSCG-928-K17]|nr:NADH-quinone oxidoreductase subunit C [Deltaproteobacteria bacterium OttesenSCG-928-K17]